MIMYILLAIIIVLLVAAIVLLTIKKHNKIALSRDDKQEVANSVVGSINLILDQLTKSQEVVSRANIETIKTLQQNLEKNQTSLENRVIEMVKQLDERMQNISKLQEEKLESMRLSNERNIKALTEDNNKQLDKMRETVDEKLSKTINERFDQSFSMLSKQLEQVYKSIGEMQTMATDVGSLTKMLNNVKTTGIIGEIQLGAILDQILSSDQYEKNVVTADGNDPVEFAIKLPGVGDDFVYLPIDSKFPYTVYTDLQNAYDSGDTFLIKQKKDQLKNTIKNMAKDINSKYIMPPKTTNFAVMFLPIEGLYAEVVKMNLLEELQRKYKVTISGPTTMSALLNSLQMGFRTLAIQKKSSEVWKTLAAVKTEFERYSEVVQDISSRFDKTSKDFDKLVGTRSRMILSKLRDVERLDDKQTNKVFDLPDGEQSGGEK